MTLTPGAAGAATDDAARARALDLLAQQRHRICDLTERVVAGQRTLQRSTVAPRWRSPARFAFDRRLADLHQSLARCVTSLRAALSECDRARSVLLNALDSDQNQVLQDKDFVGYPGQRP